MKQNKTKKSHAEKNVELINWREKKAQCKYHQITTMEIKAKRWREVVYKKKTQQEKLRT